MCLQLGGGRGRAIPIVGVVADAVRAPPPPPPPSLAASGLARRADSAHDGGSEWRGMGEREGREQGGVGAASGQEGHGWRRPPSWRRPAGSEQRGGCGRTGCMRAAVENGNVRCVFIFIFGVLKMER
jgi:hypothetical protein